jgi:prepilin signal peptidase PulO-like enzyme (type II secretory pathway)
MKTKEKLWFRAKCYGWGWYPCSWQGWFVILIWVILFIFSVIKMDHEWLKNLLFIFLITFILILICWKKGEKPRWRWGE